MASWRWADQAHICPRDTGQVRVLLGYTPLAQKTTCFTLQELPKCSDCKPTGPEVCEQMEGTGVSRWALRRQYEEKGTRQVLGTRNAKGGKGRAEYCKTLQTDKEHFTSSFPASIRSRAIMTKKTPHYHIEDVKWTLCTGRHPPHQPMKNPLHLVDVWTVQKRNVLREENLLSNWDLRKQSSSDAIAYIKGAVIIWWLAIVSKRNLWIQSKMRQKSKGSN